MMGIPIIWTFQRTSIMPIIEAKGECDIKESEPFVIQNAIEIIEKASEFKGKPYSNIPNIPCTSKFSVSFSLIFPSELDLANFIEFMQRRNNLSL